MGADLDGADGAVEQPGDLLVLEVLEAREDEDLALLERQAGEGLAESDQVLGRRGLLGGRGSASGSRCQVGRVGGDRGGGVLAEMVGGDLAGEVVDPGGEPALVAVGVPVFEDAVEDDLHEILADRRLVGQAHEETVEAPVMALEEFAEPAISPARTAIMSSWSEASTAGQANRGRRGGNSDYGRAGEEHGWRAWACA